MTTKPTEQEVVDWLEFAKGGDHEASGNLQFALDLIQSKSDRIKGLEAANQKLETELGAARDSVDHWSNLHNRVKIEHDNWKMKAKARQIKLEAL